MEDTKLKVAGWLGANDEVFFKKQVAKLKAAGLDNHFDHAGSPDRDGKRDFLRSIDVFSVPTTYREPKGMYVIEALAAEVPAAETGRCSIGVSLLLPSTRRAT